MLIIGYSILTYQQCEHKNIKRNNNNIKQKVIHDAARYTKESSRLAQTQSALLFSYSIFFYMHTRTIIILYYY